MTDKTNNKADFEQAIRASAPVMYGSLGRDAYYKIQTGEELFSFFEVSFEEFLGVCQYQLELGYELYEYNVMNGNHFATLFKGNHLLHVYWIECESELNVAISATGGASLPSRTDIPDKGYAPSVTQLKSDKRNGMGYAVQLRDGSFIVYDGGYSHHADELWSTLSALKGSEEDIVIRAWIITHAHGDHYPCFKAFSEKYAQKVTLQTLMISPINEADAFDKYLNAEVLGNVEKFTGAKILYLHTGMLFNYGDLRLEILLTPDEIYIAEKNVGHGKLIDFNNSSIVSRIQCDGRSCIFLGDAFDISAYNMLVYYGKYLKSDMCQMSHHGLENFPLIAYRHIRPSILWYPCSASCYSRDGKADSDGRDEDVRRALRQSGYTKEIIVHDRARETRYFKNI